MQGCWDAETWNNQGLQHYAKGHVEQALTMLKTAHLLLPDSGTVLVNLGFMKAAIGREDAAARCYSQAMTDAESRSSACKNLGFLELNRGNPRQGWQLHHQRLNDPALLQQHWEGLHQALTTPLLVWNDVGQGDAIQFSRYLPGLIRWGFRIRLAVQPPLIPLFQRWLPVAKSTHLDVQPLNDSAWNGVQRHLPVMGLCRLLDPDLMEASQPGGAYLSNPDPPSPNPVTELPPGRRIGLCWASNPGDQSLYIQKSIPVSLLLQGLSWQPKDQVISLQRGEEDDRRRWRQSFAAELPDAADWCETARWILSCDLVISVDTAVAHLAGALGIPVLVLVPWIADWRWRYGSNGQRWYRNCTTVQQTKLGDWSGLLHPLNQELQRHPIR